MTAKINVLAPEFPGYGIYNKIVSKDNNKGIYCSAEQIKEDAECLYDFILANFENIEERDIILLGRSMGSGPCIHLGTIKNPGALICMSSYKTIKDVAYDKFWFLSGLISEQFDNLSMIKKVESPVLFIHGKEDTLINHSHS